MSENGTEDDTPVSDTLLVMTATSLENSDLSPRELVIARIAALIAVDASAASSRSTPCRRQTQASPSMTSKIFSSRWRPSWVPPASSQRRRTSPRD